MASLENLSVGQRVMVYDAPDCKREATIVVINNPEEVVGKTVGVEFDDTHPMAHECDGAAKKKQGWWTLPENVAAIE